MKKLLLLPIILIPIIIFLPKEKINTSNKNYNVYVYNNGSYVQYNNNTLPIGGYKLNTTESSCTSGATITQNMSTRKVSVTSNKAATCNFYYDPYYPDILQIYNDLDSSDYSLYDVIDLGAGAASGSNCYNTLAFDKTSDDNLSL